MNTTHTPKPWLRNAENACHIVDREGYTIADVARAKDAPIIAAAPELLEELQGCELALRFHLLPLIENLSERVYGHKQPAGQVKKLLACIQLAIANAEGRTI